MFKKVLPGQAGEALAFLSREPEVNYFILGDVECYGLADPNIGLWVEGRGGVSAVLLRFYGSFIIYAPDGADYRHAARIMKESGFGMLSGRPEYVHPVIAKLEQEPEVHANVLMRLHPEGLRPEGLRPEGLRPISNGHEVVTVGLENLDEHIDGIVALRRSIPEFAMGINVEALSEELKMGCKRLMVAREDGMTVSMAMTTVERHSAAMIVSVCTRREYRGRGYAGALMTALCRSLSAEGKTAVLFYSNPAAGRIYTALGFEDIGRWCFASF